MHQDYTHMRMKGTGKHTCTDIVHVHTEHTMEVETELNHSETDKFYKEFLTLLRLLTKKVFMNGNQSVLNRFSTSGLNPPRPGSGLNH